MADRGLARAINVGRSIALRRPAATRVWVTSDLGELDRWRGHWPRAGRQAAGPMLDFSWVNAAARTFCPETSLRVFMCEREGRLAAVAPLVLRSCGGYDHLEALGVQELYEPTDFPALDAQACIPVARAIAASGMPLRLERIPVDSLWIPALEQAYRMRGLLRTVEAYATPYIELDASWAEPESHFNARRRSDIRRAQRHAQSFGEVSAEIHAPRSGAEAAPLVETAYRVEAAGWKGDKGSALALDRPRGEFFQRLAHEAAAAGKLRIALLRIGGEPAAMQFALEDEGAYWLFKIGYDERFAKASPGQLLMLHSVRYAAGRGLSRFEFLGSREAWTDLWTQQAHDCIAFRSYPASIAGGLAFAKDLTGALRRRISPGAR